VHHVPRQRLRSLNSTVAVVALAVTAADALSKWWARSSVAAHGTHVAGPLWWRLQYNTGVSFSFSHGLPMVTAIVTLVVAVGLLGVGLRAHRGLPTWGFGLLLGGGAANVVDRWLATPHEVTDFIAVGSFPVFNLADAAVSVGFLLLLTAVVRGKRLVAA